jgi:hypothetical protein
MQIQMAAQSLRGDDPPMSCFTVLQGVPFGALCLNCGLAAIEEHFDQLERTLDDVRCAMVVSLEETGYGECVDARSQSVVVPVSYSISEIRIPVKRQSHGCTLLATIDANMYQLNPLNIIHPQTIQTELDERGRTPELGISRPKKGRF